MTFGMPFAIVTLAGMPARPAVTLACQFGIASRHFGTCHTGKIRLITLSQWQS